MTDAILWVGVILMLVGLFGVFCVPAVRTRRINENIEDLNRTQGGDWYFDGSDRKYHDYMTNRVATFDTLKGGGQ